MPSPNINIEGTSLIPKNPVVAAVILGGVAIVAVVLLRELSGAITSTTDAIENAPGNVLAKTAAGLETATESTAQGVKNTASILASGVWTTIKSFFTGTALTDQPKQAQ